MLDFLRGRHISDRSLEEVASMTAIDKDTMDTISNVSLIFGTPSII